jgi:alpha-1,6-mannosyltransferase
LPSTMVLLFAWNPLVIVETAGSGHFDIVAVCLIAAAVLLLYRKQVVWAMVLLAMACLVKYYALAFVPLFLRHLPGKWWRPLVVFVVTLVLLWLPYISAGTRIFDSLLIFYHHWCFNSLPYYWFMQAFNARGWYLGLYAGTVGAVVLYWLRRPAARIETEVLAVTTVMVVLSPVLYPWYLVWLLPFCLFTRSFPLVLFSLVVNFSYQVLPRYLAAGIWCENERAMVAQYAVLAGSCLLYYRAVIGQTVRRGMGWFARRRHTTANDEHQTTN